MIQITKACPHCGSIDLVSNGHNKKNGKQKYYCNGCDRYALWMQLPAIVKSAKKRF